MMSLLHPGFLYGLGLVAVPIILHLTMRAKPRQLDFPALRLIQKHRRQNVQRMQLRHLLLLLLRMAALALLVLALARPSLPAADYSFSTADWMRLLLVAGLAGGAYLGGMWWWRKQGLPQRTLAYRGTLLRGGLTVAGVLLFLLLVAWPYQQRIAAAITQPSLAPSEKLPVAAVLLFDTSLSMQYQFESKTRFELAQQIAKEHVSTLPPMSRVAIADTSRDDPIRFQLDLSGAHARIASLATSPVSRPLNDRLLAGMQLQKEDQERVQAQYGGGGTSTTAGADNALVQDNCVREIYVFTDMAASAWKVGESARLQDRLKEVPGLNVYVIDVGVERPRNVAITSLLLSDQVISLGSELTIKAVIESTGEHQSEVLKKPAARSAAEKDASNKSAPTPATPDKASSDKASSDKAAPDKASSDKASSDKSRSDKAVLNQAATDQAASDTAGAGTAAKDQAAGNAGSGETESADQRDASSRQERTVELYVENEGGTLVKQGQTTVTLSPGAASVATFAVRGLVGPVSQGEVRIVASDPLSFDDVRYFTLMVQPPANVLIVADDWADAQYVFEALAPGELVRLGKSKYRCTFVPTAKFASERDGLKKYAAVWMINVSHPREEGWNALTDYVQGGGGAAIVLGSRVDQQAHVNYLTPAARFLLPAELLAPLAHRPPEFLDVLNLTHPVFRKFADWGVAGLTAVEIQRYWRVRPGKDAPVLAKYTNSQGDAALLEKRQGRGVVLLFTTGLDRNGWNDLPAAEWSFVAFVDQLTRYLSHVGQTEWNQQAGSDVVVPLDGAPGSSRFLMRTPNRQQLPHEVPQGSTLLTLRETSQLGNYRVLAADPEVKFERGFSINGEPAESHLGRIGKSELEEWLGPDRFSIARNIQELQRRVGEGRLGREVFPEVLWLLVLVFLGEHLLANRFYDAQAEVRT